MQYPPFVIESYKSRKRCIGRAAPLTALYSFSCGRGGSISNAVRNHKDNVFCLLHRGKKNLLSLYNAINGTTYEKEEELEQNRRKRYINRWKNALPKEFSQSFLKT